MSRAERSAHIDVDLPYELRALEGALHVAVTALEADTLDLEDTIGTSLDNLDQRVRPQPQLQSMLSLQANAGLAIQCCSCCIAYGCGDTSNCLGLALIPWHIHILFGARLSLRASDA